MAQISFDPTTANHSTAQYSVGGLYTGPTGKVYRYVKVVDLALAAGDVAIFTATEGTVTKDYTGGTAHIGCVAGVALGVISVGQYGFIQTQGYCSSVNVDAACVAGSGLVVPATADGRADLYAVAGANPTAAESVIGTKLFGRATAADAANHAPAILFCP